MNRHVRLARGELLLGIIGVVALSALGGAALALSQARQQMQAATRFVPDANQERQALQESYGPEHFSEDVEEWIIRDFFADRRGGFFVDVGANDPKVHSTTYYLETALGWSGIAIEPQVKFAEGFRTLRPNTVFVPLFVSNRTNERTVLYVPGGNDLIASGSSAFASAVGAVTPTETTTTTLDDVLKRLRAPGIDFLSIDIELHEPQALAGFTIGEYRPRLVGIEAHLPVRQQILDYFTANDYVLIGEYLRVDGKNLWFAPRGEIPAGVSEHTAVE